MNRLLSLVSVHKQYVRTDNFVGVNCCKSGKRIFCTSKSISVSAEVVAEQKKCSSKMKTLMANKNWGRALKAYWSLMKKSYAGNQILHSLAMTCMIKSDKPDDALRLLKSLQESVDSSDQPDLRMYNSLMNNLKQQEDQRSVLSVFEEILTSGIQPDAFTYSIIMSSLGKAKDSGRLEKFWSSIKMNKNLNVVVYTAAVNSFVEVGDYSTAVDILEGASHLWMHEAPNRFFFGAAIKAYMRAEVPEKCLSAFNRMRELNLFVSDKTLNCVMTALIDAGRSGEALEIFDEITEGSTIPSALCLCSAIRAAGEKFDDDRMQQLLSQLENIEIPNVAALSSLAVTLEKYCYFDEVSSLYSRCVRSGVVEGWAKKGNFVELDLHFFPLALARVAVIQALMEFRVNSNLDRVSQLRIITGRGNNSTNSQPILRPEIRDMLMTDFSPPLYPRMKEKNAGALEISRKQILKWARFN